MVKDVKKFIKEYVTLNTEFISFHVETENVLDNLNLIKKHGIKSGLALNPNTEVKELVPYLPLLDIIIVMSVEPGLGGQEFISETEEKIKEQRVLLNEYNSQALISVDGGVNNVTKEKCNNADILVSGSYITSNANFQERINSLR